MILLVLCRLRINLVLSRVINHRIYVMICAIDLQVRL
jgi:hypothetical protein